jgi:hypothetical protein
MRSMPQPGKSACPNDQDECPSISDKASRLFSALDQESPTADLEQRFARAMIDSRKSIIAVADLSYKSAVGDSRI